MRVRGPLFVERLEDRLAPSITPPVDADQLPNIVPEGVSTGWPAQIQAVSTTTTTFGIAYSLLDSAGGRFAIDSFSGVVTVANGSLINFEVLSSTNFPTVSYSIVVQAT